jgi:hypothetical protein
MKNHTLKITVLVITLSLAAAVFGPAAPAYAQSIDSIQACSDQNVIYISLTIPSDERAIGVFVNNRLVDTQDFQFNTARTLNTTTNTPLQPGDAIKVYLSDDDNFSANPSEVLATATATAGPCGAGDTAANWRTTQRGLPLTLVGGPMMHNGVLLLSGFVVNNGGIERGYWHDGSYIVLGWCDENGCVAAEGGPLTSEQLDILELVCAW